MAWLKNLLGPLLMEVFRGMERLLPVRVLRWLLHPYAFARALFGSWPPDRPWPACLGAEATVRTGWRNLTRHHLDRVLKFLPDRLSSPRWKSRCRVIGLERLCEARRAGRPVLLAFFHFGPFTLMGTWLRAQGIPATTLILGTARARSRADRRKDRYTPHPTVPGVLYRDQLREAVRVFSSGGTLLVAIDFPTGGQVEVPIAGGWTFRMATGAIRLAARHGAELIPCHIIQAGPWRFRIELGQPVPREQLAGEPDLVAVGKHLIAESLPHWRLHPRQCHPYLLECFQPALPAMR
jgi:hypothetical protein